MLHDRKNKLMGLALAGALTMGFAATASAQDPYGGDVHQVTYRDVHHHHHYRAYGYDRPYAYHNRYYRNGYYGGGPLDLAGAIVGGAFGVADATAAAATGYPYYRPAYGYDPYYNNGWGGPYHNQYEGYGYW